MRGTEENLLLRDGLSLRIKRLSKMSKSELLLVLLVIFGGSEDEALHALKR